MNTLKTYKFTPAHFSEIIVSSISAVTNNLTPSQLEAYRAGHSLERALQLACADRLIADRFGKRVKIKRHLSGAPQLIGSDYHISISHTGDYMAIYLSLKGPIAIDIEIQGRSIDAIKNRFAKDIELKRMNEVVESDALLYLWSIKECLFKVIPVDQVLFKEHLEVVLCVEEQNQIKSKADVVHPEFESSYSIVSRIFEPLILSYTEID